MTSVEPWARGASALTDEQREKIAERLRLKNRDRSDDGSALPLTSAALAMSPEDDGGAARLEALVAALAVERVVVPVAVESSADHSALGSDKHSPIDFARGETPIGPALVVYSSKEELAADRPQDRPMAYDAFKVCLAALVETGGRIIVDPASAAVLVPRAAVAALAQRDSWLPAWRDGELAVELRTLAGTGEGAITDVRCSYAGDGVVRVELVVGRTGAPEAARSEVSEAIQRIGASARLRASADRVEFVPRWADRA